MTMYVQQPQGSQQCHMPYVVVQNDQSVIKGLIWTKLAIEFGAVTIAGAAYTLVTSPLLATPGFPIPLALAVGTYALANITGSCIDNACYHLGSRNVVVLQAR